MKREIETIHKFVIKLMGTGNTPLNGGGSKNPDDWFVLKNGVLVCNMIKAINKDLIAELLVIFPQVIWIDLDYSIVDTSSMAVVRHDDGILATPNVVQLYGKIGREQEELSLVKLAA